MNLYYSHLIHIVIVTTDATCRREEIVFFFGGGGGVQPCYICTIMGICHCEGVCFSRYLV